MLSLALRRAVSTEAEASPEACAVLSTETDSSLSAAAVEARVCAECSERVDCH
jgi:hypothetical protein